MTFRTRFAPSPTGPLHLGHAYSACLAHKMAHSAGGTFYLRIDDLDQSRSRPEWEDLIKTDLHWLGLVWQPEVWRQSCRLPRYIEALRNLWDQGLLYPCTCTRADIRAAASAPQEGAPISGPDGLIYPGTCRPEKPCRGPMPDLPLRIDMARALSRVEDLSYRETGENPGDISIGRLDRTAGDVALARPGMGASYHLSIVCDDADQSITHVIRGADLSAATGIHVLLQRLLGFPTPIYHHHRLIRDNAGKRLAKRDDARAVSTYRDAGLTPAQIREMVDL
ncbi:MAG: tRNA glutamyl-Q(34) synthetase GluQRS [Pseudomonadota bacterium]